MREGEEYDGLGAYYDPPAIPRGIRVVLWVCVMAAIGIAGAYFFFL